ncbi:GCN5-related N-acetyltransferase [Haloferax mediterranei ATCC 33500]|uniref:GCN5-related N-acetyltransferase n=1 Tax=Haloferax mediterranei (strain ATCC 33500 / DSM 1411 / JCM 8866 / NBRC 14739 / NCIMB 2177 / R-4) TaxID=523841 RepID=I3R2L4_HALMT|nr:GCN5-related N-acetyltransferase [Haloferax mediterranei ATCC 33500]
MALHVESIRAFGPTAYDETQVAAWAEKDGGVEQYPLDDEAHHLVVAEKNDNIVGYGHLIPKAQETRAVYVHPDYGRQGVGSAILTHLEGRAREEGVAYLELWASRNAVAFYERMGYQRIGDETIEKQYEGRRVPLSVVVMEKSL